MEDNFRLDLEKECAQAAFVGDVAWKVTRPLVLIFGRISTDNRNGGAFWVSK